jgi:hypothetical protein
MSNLEVCEGQWYADRVHHEFFLVIGVDESDGLIDVRDRYGDIDEFDLDEWDAMDLVLCVPPGDWDEGADVEEEGEEQRPAG